MAEADLSIGIPQMAPGLDTERIAVLKGRQLDYYRGVRWGSQAAELIQTLLVRTLEDRRLFRSVSGEQSRVASNYFLDVSVRDFQAEYQDGSHEPSVHVSVVARLIRISDRQLVETLSASALARAESNRMHSVVAAFESAAHQVALELADKLAIVATEDVRALQSASGGD
jgi:cholesterol transport system auxiliary component